MALTIDIKGGTPKSDADQCRTCQYAMRVLTVDSENITYCRALDNSIMRTKIAECSQYVQLEFKATGSPMLLHRNQKDEIVWLDGWGRQLWPPIKKRKKRLRIVGLVQAEAPAANGNGKQG